MKEKTIDKAYLQSHPDHVFVFGDNTERQGMGGVAILRYEPNVYGFVTKILPTHDPDAYYRPAQYEIIYKLEMDSLKKEIEKNPEKRYLISRLGGGLANKYHIWEEIIEPRIREDLKGYSNVEFLWEDE